MTHDAAPTVFHRRAAPAFPVVVLAASAGGIQALGHIFRALPTDFRAALAGVQHRDPRGPGLFAAVLPPSSPPPRQEPAPSHPLQPGPHPPAPAESSLGV